LNTVTALLIEWRDQVEGAEQKLLPLVHDELRRIAKRHMAGKRPDHVLQATALVNEAYLRLVDVRQVQWQDRAHFFAMAARLMRRVPVDFARAQKNQKRAARFIASPSIRTCRLQARLTRTSSRSMRRCGRSR
jgi:RNA polymerase sigma factor (TIGR02999 family)